MKSFNELGLSEEILKILKQKGFEEPTPIQEKTIPSILEGDKDVIGQAQTGTGKTAAFGLPMVELLQEKSKFVQALVLTPTRELAIQVAEEIRSFKGNKKLSIVPIYGGQSIELQLRSLRKGIDIVVGTPGRVIDHLKRGTLKLENISFLVLDEADEMLSMGFLEEIEEIMKKTNAEKRTMLFSATMPPTILKIAQKYMGAYNVLKVNHGQLTVSKTAQIYFEVSASDKFEALCRIIDIEEEFYGVVFCKTKVDVDKIANHLTERGYDTEALHGDISQNLREKILNRFKKQHVNILVATDVAARGIDVQNITHVINYALPHDSESYVHRIGRTGRAGKEGNAITFITPSEYRKFQLIKKRTKTDIRKAKLPGVKEIIQIKKRRIKDTLQDIIKGTLQEEFIDMANELLEKDTPENAIAALLQYSFKGELNAKNYAEIENRNESRVIDMKGKTRLFVTQGKQDGLTSKKLISAIKEKCGIKNEKIKDVLILDRFAFVTLPFHDAETVLTYFKNRKKGMGIFITKAKKIRSKR